MQQGNKRQTSTDKPATNNTKITVNRDSGQTKPTIVTQSASSRTSAPVKSNGDAKPVNRSASTSNGKTMIKVQSLKQNSPRLQIGDKNAPSNDELNKLSFGDKMGIVSSALPLSHSASNLENLRSESPRTPVENESKSFTNGKLGHVVTSKSRDDISTVTKVGPMEEQRNKFTSSSADNVSKPEVVKSSVKPVKPASKVFLNADKQMIDLDSFTDRKNMLSELKGFGKPLKPVQQSSTVNQVKLGYEERNGIGVKVEEGGSNKVNGGPANPKSGLFKDIQLAKKPSELKETKAEIRKVNEKANEKDVTKAKDKDVTKVDDPTKLFDDLLKGVNSETDESESSEYSPREEVTFEPIKVKFVQEEKEDIVKIPTVVDTKSAPLSEISFAGTRQVTTIEEESEDNGTEESDEDDRFVTEFQFPGKPKSAVNAAKQKFGKCLLFKSTRVIFKEIVWSFFLFVFSVQILSVLRGHSFFFIPATTANDLRLRRISIPDLIHYIIFLSSFLRKS